MTEKRHILPFAFGTIENDAKNSSISDKDLRDMLTELLVFLEYRQGACELYLQRVIRARNVKADTVKEALKEFRNIKDLSHPPEKFAKECRCNAEGVPVFYCSVDNAVPIFETRPEAGNYIALTTYKNKSASTKLLMPPIGVIQLKKALSNRNPDDAMVRILNEFTQFKDGASNLYLETDQRISRWFTQPVSNHNKYIYRLTIAFYQMLLKRVNFGDEAVNALVYPSVESDVTGYNIVMETTLMDNNFEFESSIIYKVESKTGKTYQLRPVKDVDLLLPGGDIKWKDHDMANSIWTLNPQSPSFYHNGDESV